ncbi:glycoside hydrolase family 2 TIM barrel-domain containing protein [Colwellia sp. E2M01]|uniref:glycoside hydrolase family 2 TIM barrel-domain containing protein n=1 Tax=Colwellia sp. E2M01 TaxID=2841561 RepID=UPI001C0915FF|nr:glycoside hydrolase family 2 TIM barrel-domain containing protein [Colwellia sp. E2M01]MBU2872066.1 DUF4982 domain-containing protein [Colwellia sp. E2M01]
MIGISIGALSGCIPTPVEKDSSDSRHDASNISRVENNFNKDWLFNLDDDKSFNQFGYEDNAWRNVNVPHDWSVEFAFTQENTDGATGYLPGGVAWYRKHFTTPVSDQQKHFIHFDGIYNNAEIWINGKSLGEQHYGYSPFYFDVTNDLNPEGQENVIAIRVDRSRYIDSRWYTGSGIYRDVSFISTNSLYIPVWGTYVTTPEISNTQATVDIAIEINNDATIARDFTLTTDIVNAAGEIVATMDSTSVLEKNSNQVLTQQLIVKSPNKWDIDSPYLYKAVSKLSELTSGNVVDEYITPFGIREIEFDANTGFSLNGKALKIKGVNLHHDAGLVGAAVPNDVWRRRLEILKDAGVNAIRTAHNPASAAFLDLCDEMGFLVQAEIFDEYDNPKDKRLNQQERHEDYISRGYTEYFQKDGKKDLVASVKRDRNHPSIIMWSIGNEIEWTYPRYPKATGYFDMNANGNYFFNPPFISPEEIVKRFHESEEGEYVLAKTAKKLSGWVKELDLTRPVTANLILPSVSHITGYTDALDVIGYSYRRVIYDYGHRLFPDKMIMGTENVVQWHEWKAVEDRDFIGGTFLWTGIDYMGESHNKWPVKATASGMLDLAGFEKPSYHMMKSLWSEQPSIYLTTQLMEKSPYEVVDNNIVARNPDAWKTYVWFWHDVNNYWQYQDKDLIAVEAYTNCSAAELFVNNKSQGIAYLKDAPDHILKWSVTYQPGDLMVKGIGDCKAEDTLRTAGVFNGIDLTIDKSQITTNYNDVVHLVVQLVDDKQNPITFLDADIEFVVKGPAKILGVDNGAPDNVQEFQSNRITTSKGQALLILQGKDIGEITVFAKSANVISNTEVIKVTE